MAGPLGSVDGEAWHAACMDVLSGYGAAVGLGWFWGRSLQAAGRESCTSMCGRPPPGNPRLDLRQSKAFTRSPERCEGLVPEAVRRSRGIGIEEERGESSPIGPCR